MKTYNVEYVLKYKRIYILEISLVKHMHVLFSVRRDSVFYVYIMYIIVYLTVATAAPRVT